MTKETHRSWSGVRGIAYSEAIADGENGDALILTPVEHTTQSDWTPDVAQAMFKEIPKPAGDGYPEWVPPTSTVYYNKGDRMTYTDGKNYESLIDNNVWSPEANPAGWKEIP